MITAGVDLAAQPERTAIAIIRWTDSRAVLEDVACSAGDDAILQVVQRAGKTRIDCPFGWPAAFVRFVASHHASHLSVRPDGPGSRRSLTMRRTDLFVHERLHLTPLNVSADRIAHVALHPARQMSAS